eukprot:jgi/Mesen1/9702/ME000069S09104
MHSVNAHAQNAFCTGIETVWSSHMAQPSMRGHNVPSVLLHTMQSAGNVARLITQKSLVAQRPGGCVHPIWAHSERSEHSGYSSSLHSSARPMGPASVSCPLRRSGLGGKSWRLPRVDSRRASGVRAEAVSSSAAVPEPSLDVPPEAQYDAPVLPPLSPRVAAEKAWQWKPPRYMWRALAALIMAGQVTVRILTGRVHWRNTLQQLKDVGPGSLGVSLLTACFVGMAFTIQFVREFARLGLTRSVGGVLALAMSRELSPVVTAIIMAGRVGSSFAAELGTMQVSEQTDTLRVLRTDPVDYLVTPRVIACCVALPVLTLLCFCLGMAASALLADAVYNVSSNIILDSAARALAPWDLLSMMVKSVVFGGIIAGVSCSWGTTTMGGAKGVGESTTSAVVISLVAVFIADFALSWCFFQGAGDALKAALG